MVCKSTGSISRFQRKNWFWKICPKSWDIVQNVSKICLPNQTSKISHILADISGLCAYFSKPIFSLKPWVWADCFEYHEPYNPNIFLDAEASLAPGLSVTQSLTHSLTQSVTRDENFVKNNIYGRYLIGFISLAYLGHITVISQTYLSHISDISQSYLRHISGKSQAYFRHILGMCQTNLRHI